MVHFLKINEVEQRRDEKIVCPEKGSDFFLAGALLLSPLQTCWVAPQDLEIQAFV